MSKLPVKRTEPLTAHAAFDRILNLRAGHESRVAAAISQLEADETEAENAIADRVPSDQRDRLDVMLKTMPAAEPAPFLDDTDPGDSARLHALRSIVDDQIGWRDFEQQEEGDYEARLRQVAEMLPPGRVFPHDENQRRAVVTTVKGKRALGRAAE